MAYVASSRAPVIPRWHIDSGALEMLEAVFAVDMFPNVEARKQLGADLNVSARQIQVWFQNRRQRERKRKETQSSTELSTSTVDINIVSSTEDISAALLKYGGDDKDGHDDDESSDNGPSRESRGMLPLAPVPRSPIHGASSNAGTDPLDHERDDSGTPPPSPPKNMMAPPPPVASKSACCLERTDSEVTAGTAVMHEGGSSAKDQPLRLESPSASIASRAPSTPSDVGDEALASSEAFASSGASSSLLHHPSSARSPPVSITAAAPTASDGSSNSCATTSAGPPSPTDLENMGMAVGIGGSDGLLSSSGPLPPSVPDAMSDARPWLKRDHDAMDLAPSATSGLFGGASGSGAAAATSSQLDAPDAIRNVLPRLLGGFNAGPGGAGSGLQGLLPSSLSAAANRAARSGALGGGGAGGNSIDLALLGEHPLPPLASALQQGVPPPPVPTTLPTTAGGLPTSAARLLEVHPEGSGVAARLAAACQTTLLGRTLQQFGGIVQVITEAEPPYRLLCVSAGWQRLTGYTRDEALGQPLGFLQGPHTEAPAVEALNRALHVQMPVSVRITMYTTSGLPFVHQLSVEPLRDPTGETKCFQGTSLVLQAPGEEASAADPAMNQMPLISNSSVPPLWTPEMHLDDDFFDWLHDDDGQLAPPHEDDDDLSMGIGEHLGSGEHGDGAPAWARDFVA